MSSSAVATELVYIAASSAASGARSPFALAALLVLVALLVAVACVRVLWGAMGYLLERWWAAVKVVGMLAVALLLLVMLAIGTPSSSSAARLDRDSNSTAGPDDKGNGEKWQMYEEPEKYGIAVGE